MTVQEYNDLYKRPMVKNVKIVSSGGVTITNTNIVSEQMSLEKSLCSESNLRFGRCEAACFKVRIADIDHDFTGEWLNVTQDAKADIEGYLLTQDGKYLYAEDGHRIQIEYKRNIEGLAQLGHFKVYSDKPDNDRRWKNLTCYDRMYDILNADVAAWYNGLTFPMTIKALRDSFFNYIGVTQKTTTLVNDNFVTQGGFSVTGSLSGKTVIEAICELNGVFGVMAPDDTFDYVSLANPETLTLDYYVDGTGSYEDYVTDVITGICAKGSESDIGTSVGTTENVYTIVNNPLINGTEGTAALTTALNNLLQNVLSISFRPFQVTTYGNPMLPLGTRITINTRNQTIISYVINKEMTGVQGLRDKISAKSDKHQSENINSSYDEIYRTKGKVHELKIDVDGLVSRMATTESKLDNDYYTKSQTESKISQTESEIMTTVSNSYVTQASYNSEIQNLQDQIDGRIEYFDGNVVPTLNNPPANSWTTTATKDSHIGDLYRYHHGTPEVTDYYRFDKNTSTTPATYNWVALGESQVDEALRQAELANQKADAAQQQLDSLQSDVEDNYYTKSATDSKIQQTANSITQSVSSTYETKSDSTSKFNTADANAQGYANTALATANTNAQGYANSAKDAANAATDNKLTSYYTKTQTDSQIAQTASSITSTVSSTYETKSDATEKLNTANSNAQTYANNARDSANASTDNKLQSYYTKTETNSQIQQTASSIQQTVSQTYTTKETFENLEIGGRNILYYSEISSANLDRIKGGDGTKSVTTVNGKKVYSLSGSQYIRLWSYNDHQDVASLLKANTTYTYSAWVKYNADTVFDFLHFGHFQVINQNSTQSDKTHEDVASARVFKPSNITANTWTKISITFKTNDLDRSGFGLYPTLSMADGKTLYIYGFKLEEGNKASDWSPAPEDLEDYADGVGASTLSTANSNAQSYANAAETAAKGYTDTKLTNYYTKSDFTMTPSAIIATVTETSEELNDLTIGGRNLLRYSKVSTDDLSKISANSVTVATEDGRTVYKVTGSNTAYLYNSGTPLDVMAELLKANTTYTYSAWIKCSKTISTVDFTHLGHFAVKNNASTQSDKTHEDIAARRIYSPSSITANVWTKLTITFTTNNLDGSNFYVYPIYNTGSDTILYMYGMKLEEGNRATDWSPAPEDDETRITTTESSITQLSNQIVMKVDTNGNIVKVALSADPSTGTAFTVSANNIDFIADGNIQLTSGTIGIYSTNFQVTSDGTVTAKAGQIGGWKITSTQFYDAVADEAGTTQGAGICKYGEGYAFWAGTSFANRNNAPLLIGHNGTLRASNAIISGKVTSSDLTVTGGSINLGNGVFKVENNGAVTCSNLTATGGSIGGLSVSTNGVYYQRTSSSYCGFTSTEWPLFINASSRTNPKTGAFRVNGIGSTVARDITLTNDSGSVAEISNSSKVWINSSATVGSLLTMYDLSGSMFLYAASGSSTPRLSISGNFSASGTKSRVVDTPDYGERLLYCYETPTPMFGDVGEGKIAEDGKCYVWLDSTFSETIKTESYQVFLQKYGQGECYVTERTSRYFVVEGDAGMRFGWELKARQAGYENDRLESFIEEEPMESYDYPTEAIRHLEAIQNEREVA